MKASVILVLDCGATNVRAMAVDSQGQIVARAALANASEVAAENTAWRQWSLDAIFRRFIRCCQQLREPLAGRQVVAVCVTTFGVDGALTDADGELLYPIISWQCPRTLAVMEALAQRLPPQELQRISGVGQFSFNTVYKLFWLRQHYPELLRRARHWVFISSLINQRLTGVFSTDITMAGTSQLLDLQQRCFSPHILQALDIPTHLFPPLVQAGEVVGHLRADTAGLLGLTAGIPVVSCGHDTQFALFGAGVSRNQAVLSSGTWEILMMRSQQVDTAVLSAEPGATCELDSEAGLYNPGLQWLAGGVLEWIRQLFWPLGTPWPDIVTEAAMIASGCDGVRLSGDLLTVGGQAGWSGLNIHSRRGHFYRSALETLAVRLRENLRTLERISGVSIRELVLVGGGSRNALWNQIKADTLQLPVRVLDDAETTVLGAAMFGWQGAGVVAQASQARARVTYCYRDFYPASVT